MKSNNPVFARSREFNGSANAYGNQTYAGGGQALPGLRPGAVSPGVRRPVDLRHGHARPSGPGPDDDRLGRPEDRHHAGRRHRGRCRDVVLDR
ncbi:hypothetical protein [Nocardioides sp. B-3]|uniref:hypothetical protein n=1 Tax=Nocardioides sp. B-3 TaxID=2895565 RepID=UPI0021529726|nr:hypothetical protein [Nocardioides sp. B-3]UUZ60388.1 hypothetical protein LP418_05655 [Nocardioides sp. B-3]